MITRVSPVDIITITFIYFAFEWPFTEILVGKSNYVTATVRRFNSVSEFIRALLKNSFRILYLL